jgi:hypothetical protein
LIAGFEIAGGCAGLRGAETADPTVQTANRKLATTSLANRSIE